MAAFTRRQRWLLALLTLAALALRVQGITWGLPSETECLRSYHPDEAPFITALQYVKNPLVFPHFNLVLGTWHMYSLGGVLMAGKVLGLVTVIGDRAFYAANLPALDRVYLAARLLAALQGTLSVPLLALLGARYYDARTGLLGALLLAVVPLHVYNSHFGYVVTPTLFWALLAWLALARLQYAPVLRRRDLLLAGCLIMLATLVQYVALLLIPLLALAVVLRRRDPATPLPRAPRWWLTALAALAGGLLLGTLIGCPNAWFDFPGFLTHFGFYFTDRLSSANKAAYNFYEPALQFYLLKAPYENFGVVLAAVAAAGGLLALLRRTPADWALLGFCAVNLVLLCRLRWYVAHYLLLLMPAMLLMAARLLTEIRRPLLRGLTVAVVAGATLAPTLALNARLAAPDIRTETSRWLEANLPAGTSLGVNAVYFYSVPAVQRAGGSPFRVVTCNFSADTLAREAPEYFLLCDYEFGMAGSVLREDYQPELRMAAFYRELFRTYRAVREFHRPLTFAGVDWLPPNALLSPYPRLRLPWGTRIADAPSWHWRYAMPRLWLLRRGGPANVRIMVPQRPS